MGISIDDFSLESGWYVFKNSDTSHTKLDYELYEKIGRNIKFVNIVFTTGIFLQFFGKQVRFINCKFLDGAKFRGANNNLWFENNLSNFDIDEQSSEINIDVVDENQTLYFGNDLRIRRLEINVIKDIKSIQFSFSDVKEISIFSMYKKPIISNIEFSIYNQFELVIQNIKIKRIDLKDCPYKSISFEGIESVSDYPLFIDVKDVTNLYFVKCRVNELLAYSSGGTNLDNFFIEDCNFINGRIDLSSDIHKNKINHFRIIDTTNFLFEKKIYINRLSLEGICDNIIVNQSTIKYLNFNGIVVINKVEFNDVKIDSISQLSIIDSLLNKVIIKTSFLHLFDNINYVNSSMEGVVISNFKEIFPIRINDDCDKIEFLRFLKTFSNKQDNLPLYQKYKAFEFEELRKSKDTSRKEKFVLWFNKVTNNYVTDWFRAFSIIICMIGFHFALATSYLLYTSQINSIWDTSLILPNIFSPFSFLVSLKQFTFHNGIYFFDFAYNLIYALVLYQMIAAFRKFNK
ncbi:hypothetical protein [Echinicola shivajiensis]|uniref:hypothetical protein n=1 Tax=Echinicola shivajiensis TaxID=1035916 RepID=UPI001BFC6D27|nr:hypothetical protein [Echinicola shivajiensis]